MRFLPLLLAAAAFAQDTNWPAIEREQKPWTRWWWLGSAVTEDGIRRELDAFAKAGIGGVEITPIYAVKGETRNISYLSPEWIRIISFTGAEAQRRGMGIDLTPGSGWRIGGPFLDPKHVNKRARIRRVDVPQISVYSYASPGVLEATAYPDTSELSKESSPSVAAKSSEAVSLTPFIKDNKLEWSVPPGKWTVYLLEQTPSGETVKRAAPGGEGPTIDIYSAAAMQSFFQAFDQKIEALPKGAVRSWFHDSFEYTGDWSPELFSEFQRRRGYDLRLYLRELSGAGNPDRAARVISDYRETLSDMLRDNAIVPLGAWARTHSSVSRNQAHGSPGNLIDLYAASDIPETEVFGPLGNPDHDPLVNKFASSAAHLTGKRLTSSESFTWLSEHFTETLSDMKRAADQLLLAGINHIFFHGTAYSDPAAAWPGWLFYASSQINPRNTIWRDLPALNTYIARCQSILQSGQPSNDVLLYWPYYDVIDDPGPMFQDLGVNSPSWFRNEPIANVARELWSRGYSFDHVSDALLRGAAVSNNRVTLGNAEFRAVLVPPTDRMPAETFEKLLSLAEAGASVVFLKHVPNDVPGLANLEDRRARFFARRDALMWQPAPGRVREARIGRNRVLLATEPHTGLRAAGVPHEAFVSTGDPRADLFDSRLQYIRRKHEDGYSYFLANLGGARFEDWLPMSVTMEGAVLMDPMSGAAGVAQVRQNREVRLQLEPGQSIVIRTFDSRAAQGENWRYLERARPAHMVTGPWTVTGVAGGPVLPPQFTTNTLDTWTAQGGEWERFAGTAVYRVSIPKPDTERMLLELGSVKESARVKLNGEERAVLIHAPYQVVLDRWRDGENILEIEVTNLAANRIRDMDRRKVEWKIFTDANVLSLRYQPFDASQWPVRASGLLGPVHLTPLQ
jgi:hypothetical protein